MTAKKTAQEKYPPCQLKTFFATVFILLVNCFKLNTYFGNW